MATPSYQGQSAPSPEGIDIQKLTREAQEAWRKSREVEVERKDAQGNVIGTTKTVSLAGLAPEREPFFEGVPTYQEDPVAYGKAQQAYQQALAQSQVADIDAAIFGGGPPLPSSVASAIGMGGQQSFQNLPINYRVSELRRAAQQAFDSGDFFQAEMLERQANELLGIVAQYYSPTGAGEIGALPTTLAQRQYRPMAGLAGEISALPAGYNLAFMANGGIVTQPTAAIVGERGPEMVMGGGRNTAFSPSQRTRARGQQQQAQAASQAPVGAGRQYSPIMQGDQRVGTRSTAAPFGPLQQQSFGQAALGQPVYQAIPGANYAATPQQFLGIPGQMHGSTLGDAGQGQMMGQMDYARGDMSAAQQAQLAAMAAAQQQMMAPEELIGRRAQWQEGIVPSRDRGAFTAPGFINRPAGITSGRGQYPSTMQRGGPAALRSDQLLQSLLGQFGSGNLETTYGQFQPTGLDYRGFDRLAYDHPQAPLAPGPLQEQQALSEMMGPIHQAQMQDWMRGRQAWNQKQQLGSQIYGLAGGGKINQPMMALVGEEGPELAMLQPGDAVIPLPEGQADKIADLLGLVGMANGGGDWMDALAFQEEYRRLAGALPSEQQLLPSEDPRLTAALASVTGQASPTAEIGTYGGGLQQTAGIPIGGFEPATFENLLIGPQGEIERIEKRTGSPYRTDPRYGRNPLAFGAPDIEPSQTGAFANYAQLIAAANTGTLSDQNFISIEKAETALENEISSLMKLMANAEWESEEYFKYQGLVQEAEGRLNNLRKDKDFIIAKNQTQAALNAAQAGGTADPEAAKLAREQATNMDYAKLAVDLWSGLGLSLTPEQIQLATSGSLDPEQIDSLFDSVLSAQGQGAPQAIQYGFA
jgi:hypothetical protein